MRLESLRLVSMLGLLAGACTRDGADSGSVDAPLEGVGEPKRLAELDRIEAVAHQPLEGVGDAERSAAPDSVDVPLEPAGPASPRADRLELTFVGDIIFGRYREVGFVPIVADPSYDPFAAIRPALAADVVVGNLETPVVEVLPATSPSATKYRFGGSRAMVRSWLCDFTILSLANNHHFDLGVAGQRESPRILAEEGITPVGAGRAEPPLHRVETHVAKGWRIGLVAATTVVNVPSPAEGPQVPYVALEQLTEVILPLVEDARADHDLIVVVVHWGGEYFEAPSRAQVRAAHQLVEGGVDMVIGSHPHVLQAIEPHGDGLIAYSLGNFLFEHTTSKPRLMGVLRTAWEAAPEGTPRSGSRLVDVVLHVAVNERWPHPHPAPATGMLAARVRERIIELGRRQGARWMRISRTEDLRLALGG